MTCLKHLLGREVRVQSPNFDSQSPKNQKREIQKLYLRQTPSFEVRVRGASEPGSQVSSVEPRAPQAKHSRRRRTRSPSAFSLESITSVGAYHPRHLIWSIRAVAHALPSLLTLVLEEGPSLKPRESSACSSAAILTAAGSWIWNALTAVLISPP